MRRPFVLAALLVLAGCSGLAGQPTATVTPAPLPPDTPARQSFPPGTGAQGVTDPLALANAHRGIVEGVSYTVLRSRTVRFPNGSLAARTTLDARFSANQSRFHLVYRVEGPSAGRFDRTPIRVELWSDGDLLLQSLTVANETTRQQVPSETFSRRPSPFDETRGDQFGLRSHDREVRLLFLGVDVTLTRRTVDGTTVYRARGDAVRQRTALENLERVTAPRNVHLNATVTSRGLVRSYDLRYDATLDGHPVRVERSVRFVDVNATTIDRPSWYGATVNTTGRRPVREE